MNKKKIFELMGQGNNCSQTVLLYFIDKFNIEHLEAQKISSCFESGMFIGDTCGAVSGAYMVLGFRFSDGKKESRSLLRDKVLEFLYKFEKKQGTVKCEDLLGINIKTDENLGKAFADGTIEKVCPGCVMAAVEILEEMIQQK